MSTASTLIPSIGMTFTQAAARVLHLVHEEDSTPGGDEANDHRDALHDEWSAIRDEVFVTPPETATDVVAILDILLHPSIGLPAAMIREEEVQAIQRLRELLAAGLTVGQRSTPANDTLDPFTAALAVLDVEAAGPLCMPQAPTSAMIEAGAAALGITNEQFRDAYTAAADAYAKEMAA